MFRENATKPLEDSLPESLIKQYNVKNTYGHVPDFSFVNDVYREMIINAYITINRIDAWEWLKNFEPNPEEGFMFSTDITAKKIMKQIAVDFDDHDIGSLARTMRTLELIAKYGFKKFHEFYFSELPPTSSS